MNNVADRRNVDELTIEELEQLLIVKRREARAARMRRLAEIGVGFVDAPVTGGVEGAIKGQLAVMAGGVARNCVANGKLLRRRTFKDIWIQPAAGDAGGSLGAALAAVAPVTAWVAAASFASAGFC